MAQNKSTPEIARLLLEKLKANGTFDEFRRVCVSDIEAKSSYQNWKQQIESSALQFLSKIEYTPELKKNIVWEKMRKHLLDGHDNPNISDEADIILNQFFASKTLDAFEPIILKVVNEYLGNENGTDQTRVNDLNESTTSLKNISKNQINVNCKPQKDLVSDIENMDNVEETSPEFEPLTSFLDCYSNDGSVSGLSDLASVGSPEQIIFKKNIDTNSNGFQANTDPTGNLQQTHFNKSSVNHKNKSTYNESNSSNFIFNNSDKLKTNDLKFKNKYHSSKLSGRVNSEDKSSSNRSKNCNYNSHRFTSREKNKIKKSSYSNSKDGKKGVHTKYQSNSKDRDKKSPN